MNRPGLSVGLWGPSFWEFLHCIAYYNDSKTPSPYQAHELDAFFNMIQPLLPCPSCSESYRDILALTIQAKKKTVIEACKSRQMTLFVYQLHEFVNKKLLKQKWQDFLASAAVRPSTETAALSEEQVWMFFNMQPSLGLIYRRQETTSNEPLHLDSLWLLILAILQRQHISLQQNFTVFLSVLVQTLDASKFKAARNMATSIRLCGSNHSLLFGAYKKWLDEQTGFSASKESFMSALQHKLDVMISSECGKSTCK